MNLDSEADRIAIRKLVDTLYRSISGPAGSPRAWSEFETCFAAEGRLMPFHTDPAGGVTFDLLTPRDYIASRDPLFKSNPFYESEVEHRAVIEGRIAHVFSRYEARRGPSDPPFTSGVNSIQLVRLAAGWKIVSITWHFTGTGDTNRQD